ncbi:MAG: thioesterase family protein, partial [Erythrobacter sp.]
IQYLDEVGPGDLLEIYGVLLKIGGKSITTKYEMRNLTRDNLAANLESVSVHFDLEQRKSVPIPEGLREKATAYLTG